MGIKEGMFKQIVLAALAIMIISSGLGAFAQNQESKWTVRVRGLVVDGDQAFSVEDEEGGTVLAGGDAALGAGIAVEYRATKWLGVELGTAFAKVPDFDCDKDCDDDCDWGDKDLGEGPSFIPVMASFNFHLTPEQRLDLYAGPTIAFIRYGDFDLDLEGGSRAYECDDDFAWGGTIGVDIPFGDSAWGFNAAVTYLTSDMEVKEIGSNEITKISYDPLMVQAGVSFSF